MGPIGSIIYLAILVLVIVSLWKVFEKAGQPGWMSLIPILNLYILIKISGKPEWWLILFFIPLANLIIAVIVNIAFAERFGKDIGFAVGLIFLPFIFYPILAFGNVEYRP